MPATKLSISQAAAAYLDTVRGARSENTARTYRNGIVLFLEVIKDNGLDPELVSAKDLKEEGILWLAAALKNHAPTSERLYLTAATGFYEYLTAEKIANINLPRIRLLIKQRARRPGQRLPQFPVAAIDKIIEHMQEPSNFTAVDETERLRNLRDRAFLLTLADTGLRVHEACNLRRGDLDWNEGRAIIIGKGNREDIVRFSGRAMEALQRYLQERASYDGNSGKSLTALPLFARHDKGAGKKTKPMTTTTGRNIVTERVVEILGNDARGTITPHSFRHYFVTRVLLASGNLKLAQELARHRNIAVTQRYAHLSNDELDKGYWEIFEEK